jgi:hypothetical protein
MTVLLLRGHWGPFCSSSDPAYFVFGLLCAPRSHLNSPPPVPTTSRPPKSPQSPSRKAKCLDAVKPTTLQSRLFAKSAL